MYKKFDGDITKVTVLELWKSNRCGGGKEEKRGERKKRKRERTGWKETMKVIISLMMTCN